MVRFPSFEAGRSKVAAFFCLCCFSLLGQTVQGQAFVLDTTAVAEEYRQYFLDAERNLNSRIQGYSNELPTSLLYQLDRLYIVAVVAPAPPGVLGFAGPNATVTYLPPDIFRPRRIEVPVTGQITINSNEIDFMLADNLLEDVILHEILHVFGVGSLWAQNGLTAPISTTGPGAGGAGLTQYVGGRYALEQFRIESNNRFAGFVPLEQRGGGGTALAHWADEGPFFNQVFSAAFKKELMTGFACDSPSGTGDDLVCAPKFLSMTTEGSMADLGYAMFKINPNRTPPPTGLAGRNWPKIVGTQLDPFADPNGPFGGNGALGLRRVNIVKVYKSNPAVTGGVNAEEPTIRAQDPFNLRNHAWAK